MTFSERSQERRDAAVVRDGSVDGVDAYLVEPAGEARGAGVLFLHWFDTEAPDGDRTQFLDEAVELAGRGVVSLLPQGSFPWAAPPTGADADVERIERQLAEQQAMLDLLAGYAGHLAVVGHDFGAMYATLLLTRDRRPRGAVLIAGTPRWGDWFLPFWPIADPRIDYLRALEPLDPIAHVGDAAPAELLFQYARHDFYIATMTGLEFHRAASEPKAIAAYDAEHDMRVDAARADRHAFLARILELGPG